MDETLENLLKRFSTTAEDLRKKLKFAAVIVLVRTYTLNSLVQVICDLVSSKDGTLLGPKRDGRKDK